MYLHTTKILGSNHSFVHESMSGRKTCGKRRKCWLPAFSSFPTMLSTLFTFSPEKTRACLVQY